MLYVKVIINAIAKANCSSDCLHLQTYFDTGHICLKLTLSSRMIEWKVGLIFRRGQQQRNGPGKMGTFKQAQQKRKCPVSNREGGGILGGLLLATQCILWGEHRWFLLFIRSYCTNLIWHGGMSNSGWMKNGWGHASSFDVQLCALGQDRWMSN